MYNGKMTSVKGMSALDKMNYMSTSFPEDMIGRVQADGTYKPAPNTADARAFRRSIAKDLGLSGEELRSFVEGDINSPFLSQTQGLQPLKRLPSRHWREVTRQAFLKPTTTTTEGGGTKIEEPDFVRDRYQFNLNQISEEDRLLAGIMGPLEGEEIKGDGTLKSPSRSMHQEHLKRWVYQQKKLTTKSTALHFTLFQFKSFKIKREYLTIREQRRRSSSQGFNFLSLCPLTTKQLGKQSLKLST